nr:ribosomal protein L20 [Gloiopeltis furcata]
MKNIKVEFVQTRSRRVKKHDLSKELLIRINSSNHTSHGFYACFARDQKVQINRKTLVSLLTTENGSSFSLQTWLFFSHHKFI